MMLLSSGPGEPTTFIAEHYWPGITAERFHSEADRLHRSSDAAAAEGKAVRLLHSTVVTEDETAFCVFEAESQEAVRQVYARAGVRFERLLDAVEINPTKGKDNENDLHGAASQCADARRAGDGAGGHRCGDDDRERLWP